MNIEQQRAIWHAFEVQRMAREVYGNAAQDRMIVEESAEFIAKLMQLKRGRCSQDEVDEEIADMLVVLLGCLRPGVVAHILAKTDRLLARLIDGVER